MSQRLGMADGRCFTIHSSAQLVNNYIMKQNGIALEDNYRYRQLLQKSGPEILDKVNELQGNEQCNQCNKPLLNVADIY
jgi:hypothetical protein